jgi:hypothetical protein
MRAEQTVKEMAEEVLWRQAKALVERTGQPFENALKVVSETDAGRQLRELADSEHHERRAREWQTSLPCKRAQERHYWWLESYMECLEGKELRAKQVRAEYHALLEEDLASLASLRG